MEWLSNQTNVSEAPFLFETWMKNATNSAEFIYLLNKGAGLDLDPNSSIVSVKPQPSSPPTPSPTPAPSAPATKVSNSVTVVVAAVAGVGCSLLVAVCLWFFYVRRRHRKKQQQQIQKASTTGKLGFILYLHKFSQLLDFPSSDRSSVLPTFLPTQAITRIKVTNRKSDAISEREAKLFQIAQPQYQSIYERRVKLSSIHGLSNVTIYGKEKTPYNTTTTKKNKRT